MRSRWLDIGRVLFFLRVYERIRCFLSILPVISYLSVSEKSAFLDSSGLKSVFEKLRSRDGLVHVGDSPNLEIKPSNQISPA